MHHTVRKRVRVGETVTLTMPWSEVMISMRIVDQTRQVKIIDERSAQILNDDGTPYSFPVLLSEAGMGSCARSEAARWTGRHGRMPAVMILSHSLGAADTLSAAEHITAGQRLGVPVVCPSPASIGGQIPRSQSSLGPAGKP